MKKMMHSPWFILTLVIAGLVAGYSAVVVMNDGVMAAQECPAKEHCQGGDCANSNDCASGDCSKDCPGNCHKEES